MQPDVKMYTLSTCSHCKAAKKFLDDGSCYCNLYVSREWNEGITRHVYVPERRPF
ncbi:MAG: hypothetical protein Q8O44_05605 [Syntrophales bacterium]|nr:hypothetical protein [Syntrophales bacterium]